MSTHVPGFQSFFQVILHHSVLAKLATTSIRDHTQILQLRKLLMREMSIRAKATTLLQILCKIILNFKVIVKHIIDPENNFRGTLRH